MLMHDLKGCSTGSQAAEAQPVGVREEERLVGARCLIDSEFGCFLASLFLESCDLLIAFYRQFIANPSFDSCIGFTF